jgi:hypothetical protein
MAKNAEKQSKTEECLQMLVEVISTRWNECWVIKMVWGCHMLDAKTGRVGKSSMAVGSSLFSWIELSVPRFSLAGLLRFLVRLVLIGLRSPLRPLDSRRYPLRTSRLPQCPLSRHKQFCRWKKTLRSSKARLLTGGLSHNHLFDGFCI